MKRTFDMAIALVGLILVLPLMAAIALLIKLGDGGPVLFLQSRIGRFGKPFRIFKFRTMVVPSSHPSIPLTVGDDPRITRVGRWLRSTKLDELPQLWNVLIGDMSIVGPRPETSEYLDRIRREVPLMLSVRPGITGPASIKYRREAQLLGWQVNPYLYYDRVILPDKLRINEAYVRDYSFISDLKYLWATIFSHSPESSLNSIALHDGQSSQAA